MTRLLVVTTGLGIGGTERHLLAVLPRLRAHGFEPRIACLRTGGALAPDFAAAGIEVTACDGGGGPAGAISPYHRATLTAGSPSSAKVGTCGSSGLRLGLAAASTRILPEVTCCSSEGAPSNIT